LTRKLTTDRRYRTEKEGRSHLVDIRTGKPLDPRIVPAGALTSGQRQAERGGC
jgi:hypothetical protein